MPGVTPARPYVLRENDGESLWFLGNLVTLKVTGAQTRGRITVAEFLNPAGFAPPLHRHLDEDEMFYLLSRYRGVQLRRAGIPGRAGRLRPVAGRVAAHLPRGRAGAAAGPADHHPAGLRELRRRGRRARPRTPPPRPPTSRPCRPRPRRRAACHRSARPAPAALTAALPIKATAPGPALVQRLASGLPPSRASADLSISQAVTAMPGP